MDSRKPVDDMVKSTIISRKGGVPLHELNTDFKNLVGEEIPYQKYGFENLTKYLKSVQGVYIQNGNVFATSEKTKHIENMISKQKENLKVKPRTQKKRYHPYNNNYRNNEYTHHGHKANHVSHRDSYSHKYTRYYHEKTSYESVSRNTFYRSEVAHRQKTPTHSQQYLDDLNNNIQAYVNEALSTRYCLDCKYYMQWGSRCQYHGGFNEPYVASRDFTDDVHLCGQNFKKRDDCFYGNWQVMGDELMLDYLCRRRNEKIHQTTTCAKGMNISEAWRSVLRHGCHSKVLIALGSIDILEYEYATDMIRAYSRLLESVHRQGASIAVCTIPPSPSFSYKMRAEVNLFNWWLVSADHGATVVNLNHLFKHSKGLVRYELFEKKVFSYPNQLVLWNGEGCRLVEKALKIL